MPQVDTFKAKSVYGAFQGQSTTVCVHSLVLDNQILCNKEDFPLIGGSLGNQGNATKYSACMGIQFQIISVEFNFLIFVK